MRRGRECVHLVREAAGEEREERRRAKENGEADRWQERL